MARVVLSLSLLQVVDFSIMITMIYFVPLFITPSPPHSTTPFLPPMLILASGSPRRKRLLELIGIPFKIIPAQVEERNRIPDPRALVETNARIKSGWVARRYPADWILGSDTTVSLGREILGKPRDLGQAREMLKRLADRTHTVYTAVSLVNLERKVEELLTVTSRVTFKPLDDATISEYFKVVNPLDKAGSYGIQDGGERVVDHWKGSYSNIMGLPLEEVGELLRRHELL